MALRNKFKNVRRTASGPSIVQNRLKYGHAAAKRQKSTSVTSVKRKLVCVSCHALM